MKLPPPPINKPGRMGGKNPKKITPESKLSKVFGVCVCVYMTMVQTILKQVDPLLDLKKAESGKFHEIGNP